METAGQMIYHKSFRIHYLDEVAYPAIPLQLLICVAVTVSALNLLF